MLTKVLQERLIIFLALFSILLKLFSLNAFWVEKYYSTGFYVHFSSIMRWLTKWLPFSIGDVLYLVIVLWLTIKIFKAIRLVIKGEVKALFKRDTLRKYVKIVLIVYILFQVFWGLNYDRIGIAEQLMLSEKPYTTSELVIVTEKLLQKVNFYAAGIDSVHRSRQTENSILRDSASMIFNRLSLQHKFLFYRNPSIKTSMFSGIGHYVGFTGYYNPLSGEAQVSNAVPLFARPFIASHEIAHQLGYGKESEASFVAYLACSRSANIDFAYSIYFELYSNAVAELKGKISAEQLNFLSQNMHPRVVADVEEWKKFIRKHRNFIEPLISKIYDRYLKLNRQPKGKETYNEVLVWLIAYLRKHGVEAL